MQDYAVVEELNYFKINVVICQIYAPTVLDLVLRLYADLSELRTLNKLCHIY